jgi:hypothetical protein
MGDFEMTPKPLSFSPRGKQDQRRALLVRELRHQASRRQLSLPGRGYADV